MHGLMGDRFLKRFLRSIRRKVNSATVNETGLQSEDDVNAMNNSECFENDRPQEKEATENIEEKDEISK